MNIANPCKAFFIAGALALGFAVQADGTLPIPGTDSSLQLPLLMGGATSETVDGILSKRDISMSLDNGLSTEISKDVVKACAKIKASPVAHAASGTVQVGDELFEIQGLCAPKVGVATDRSVIATTSGRLLQLDGSFKVSTSTSKLSFAGKALTIDTLSSTPESGEAPSVSISFQMDQVEVPLD